MRITRPQWSRDHSSENSDHSEDDDGDYDEEKASPLKPVYGALNGSGVVAHQTAGMVGCRYGFLWVWLMGSGFCCHVSTIRLLAWPGLTQLQLLQVENLCDNGSLGFVVPLYRFQRYRYAMT